MEFSLIDGIQEISGFHSMETGYLSIPPSTHLRPGGMVVLAAYINKHHIQQEKCIFPNKGYMGTIGFYSALWGNENCGQKRINVGKNYSLLTPLTSAEMADEATTSINGCIRRLAYPEGAPYPAGITALNHVVGEMHDNVWSHGKSTGYSFAQKTAVPGTDRQDYYLEFALADCGLGFLRELKRVNILGINNHKESIEWCIQEGHSSKHVDLYDGWSQQLPDGHIGGNVFGLAVPVREYGNNHQGLGLTHLVALVKRYEGELMLASGDSCLHYVDGSTVYKSLTREWQGVALSCRFKLSRLSDEPEEQIPHDIQNIMERLQGGAI
ncbi:hypothetical protein EXB91_24745 [Salmonella enterica subsp. enterica serovar Florida]|uniref:Uncharacterized protein n=3 Tax=Salmonella enterica I TaxID=59201 RepID=A0A5U8JGP2_SALET|nr:hypothetical protein [Salmonella enterica]EBR7996902.1 hypothetical protein [Salmonella enterica subsp. enterica serovar Panama]EBS4088747.1 hypothetical protein [Salmonella enterica subsp. enterica serovar Newport]ECG3786835.1 hypothetical protein [Salmonella enterica subsp. enterica serovar Florida]ASD87214.1 hypothetical protein LFZ16_13790 [Salmonella enterica subsp. enterica serovar India str. SA20085604]EBR8436479.1 hypothetical protein [Salmonella enterica subsp. enterica serovar Pan